MTIEPGWQKAAASLEQGLEKLGVVASTAQQQQLLQYLQLLQRWNQISNMTAVKTPEAMVCRHLLDSIAILPWLNGTQVLDIGSGAGLPGVPLSILATNIRFVLLDSRRKRTRFLLQVVAELGLENVSIVTARVEQYRPVEKFDTLTARAFAPLPKMLRCCEHLCAAKSRVMALKSRSLDSESGPLPVGWQQQADITLTVPGLSADRRLLLLQRTSMKQDLY